MKNALARMGVFVFADLESVIFGVDCVRFGESVVLREVKALWCVEVSLWELGMSDLLKIR